MWVGLRAAGALGGPWGPGGGVRGGCVGDRPPSPPSPPSLCGSRAGGRDVASLGASTHPPPGPCKEASRVFAQETPAPPFPSSESPEGATLTSTGSPWGPRQPGGKERTSSLGLHGPQPITGSPGVGGWGKPGLWWKALGSGRGVRTLRAQCVEAPSPAPGTYCCSWLAHRPPCPS